jgi:RecB family endonuclease NucS
MRIIVADCIVTYEGRLGARLPLARRLLMMKADGSFAIHSDSKAFKPLNWMTPPCTIDEKPESIVVYNKKGEELRVEIAQRIHEYEIELGDEPGLEKDGVEKELQELIAARVDKLKHDFELIRREFPTDIGPVDLLVRDSEGTCVAVEVKRIGEIAGVDQLLRYIERIERDNRYGKVKGMFVATKIKEQAKVYAESREIDCVEVDLIDLRESESDRLRLF